MKKLVLRHGFNLAQPSVPNMMSSVQTLCKRESQKPLRVAVEGNIGSGKSLFVNHFKQFPYIETYEEPIEKWKNLQGHNLLSLLYSDMETYNAVFQSYVQLTRTELQMTTPKEGARFQMFERSVQNNRYCFLEVAYQTGNLKPAQYCVLLEWFEWLQKNVNISIDIFVYLRSSPIVAFKRVIERGRPEEKNISLKYLEDLHKAHDLWLQGPNMIVPVITLDADQKKDEIIKSCYEKIPILFRQ